VKVYQAWSGKYIITIVLAMLVSLTAECITVIRHLPLSLGRGSIPLLLACEGAVTILVLWALTLPHSFDHRSWTWRQPGIWFGAVCVLFFCPEWPGGINSTAWHFVTVVTGFFILLVVVRGVLLFFAEAEAERIQKFDWIEKAIAACGVITMLCGFFAVHDALSMLTLTTIGGLLLTYGFLAAPLNLLPGRQAL
jgi:hypothetical protein